MKNIVVLGQLLLLVPISISGFVIPAPNTGILHTGDSKHSTTRLWAELPSIEKMKAVEMKRELESYGISTRSLFEKSEFAVALAKARAEGKTVVEDKKDNKSDDNDDSEDSSRAERYQKALEEAQGMSVKAIKRELTDRGVSTTAFFEKSDFVHAYAEAIADNKTSGGTASDTTEPYDPSYRDVMVQKIDRRQMAGQMVIDVTPR